MAIKTTLKNKHDADTVHAVVRMDEKNWRALNSYMHGTDEIAIHFPQGVSLYPRGRGWYRLDVQGPNKAVERIEFALKVIRRFMLDEERKVEEAIKVFAPALVHNVRATSYTAERGFGYAGKKIRPAEPTPASPHKLHALVAKFGRSANHKV